MSSYWIRHRLLYSLILCVVFSIIAILFVSTYIEQRANSYNSQSIYKNTALDFIAPEPSFEQVKELPESNGIDKVFPFYMTKVQVNVGGKSRTTTVLLSDDFSNIDITMYNEQRLIECSKLNEENPMFVDLQFCRDTSAQIGDEVIFSVAGQEMRFVITAIYESNSIYEGGAILGQINEEQKKAIDNLSNNNGYSGMYISSSDYNTCRAYLTTEYRPLGRLRSREQFDSEEQYDMHYDAIMSTGYANEITDFRVRENSNSIKGNSVLIWVGAVFSAFILIIFNVCMARRGCENVYFEKHCIPKGQDVKPYYLISFVFEIVACLILYVISLIIGLSLYNDYISKVAIDIMVIVIPVTVMITEIICWYFNYSAVSEIKKKVKIEEERRKLQMKVEFTTNYSNLKSVPEDNDEHGIL